MSTCSLSSALVVLPQGVLNQDCITSPRTPSTCAVNVDHAVLLVGWGTDDATKQTFW